MNSQLVEPVTRFQQIVETALYNLQLLKFITITFPFPLRATYFASLEDDGHH